MEISRLIDRDNMAAVLLKLPLDPRWKWIKHCSDICQDRIQPFFNAIRNPLNKNGLYQIELIIINRKNPDSLLNVIE